MPVYEYMCNGCQRRVSVLLRDPKSAAKCPVCGGKDLSRRFSSFSVRGTYKDVYDSILDDDQLTSGMLRNDPRALAEWNKRMQGGMESGHEPSEYDEYAERMERGEGPQIPGVTAPRIPPPDKAEELEEKAGRQKKKKTGGKRRID